MQEQLPNGQKWYLAYCKPREEQRAQTHLSNQGVVSYYPTARITKIRRGKRSVEAEPLFPNYLFVRADLSQINPVTLSSTRGISKFVRFGYTWSEIPDELLCNLINHENDPTIREKLSLDLQIGQKVEITEGPFQGVDAIYKEPDGEKRSLLLINLLHQDTPISVDNRSIKY